jgi:hypothetical protein
MIELPATMGVALPVFGLYAVLFGVRLFVRLTRG